MDEEIKHVTLRLWDGDAIVLFDWLMGVDLNAVPTTHRAQKQALMDLLTCLESQTLAPHATDDEIKAAQERCARDMGW